MTKKDLEKKIAELEGRILKIESTQLTYPIYYPIIDRTPYIPPNVTWIGPTTICRSS